ncbi:hypothetical protein E4U03_09520 [Rothia nasimurium]|uniref:Uncharacterized protein n=1 Tax=Rothia nasimurium TaxID=85336 RepID=A0A4Y9F1P5_9MICC|nr:hypothetical protein [Rothia nasimurium]MBF0808838.1 hypothetical protein [Rothia nasimurium]TFU21284.1 hypothetical protein E4U03_09520 [Rothia nasimurium]
MKNIGATLLAAALVYGSHRVVSAIEYHAQRTGSMPPTISQAREYSSIVHIPDRKEFQKHIENFRATSHGKGEELRPYLGYPLIESLQKKSSARMRRLLSRVAGSF